MRRPERVIAAIGLGSNLDNPAAQIHRALETLSKLAGTTLVASSPFYRSTAIGPDGLPVPQPDFCNAVALLETELSPRELLAALQALETAQGRTRPARWAARSLDLDLLVYGNCIVDEPGMNLPHPRMSKRNFVLYPLRDIAPDLHIPGQGRVSDLAARLDLQGLQAWCE